MLRRRDYVGPDDLRAMQGLAQRLWVPGSHWHIGDLAWGRFAIPDSEGGWRTSLWSDGDEVRAWGWVERPGHLDLLVDPGLPELATDVLEWADSVTEDGPRTCTVMESESHVVEVLERDGYDQQVDAPYFTHHRIELSDLAMPCVPDGFTLRHVTPADVDERAAAHRRAWSDLAPSRMSRESYARVMRGWPYRCELDWVIVGPDGSMVASALGWLDEENREGLLEPVGCAPELRRLGLAGAVNLAAMTALRDAGATHATVCPRGDDDYPVPGKLYRSIGFEPGARTVTFVR